MYPLFGYFDRIIQGGRIERASMTAQDQLEHIQSDLGVRDGMQLIDELQTIIELGSGALLQQHPRPTAERVALFTAQAREVVGQLQRNVELLTDSAKHKRCSVQLRICQNCLQRLEELEREV